jgi:hypothetical protein
MAPSRKQPYIEPYSDNTDPATWRLAHVADAPTGDIGTRNKIATRVAFGACRALGPFGTLKTLGITPPPAFRLVRAAIRPISGVTAKTVHTASPLESDHPTFDWLDRAQRQDDS